MAAELLRTANGDLTLGAFLLTRTGLAATGEPSFEEWAEVQDLLSRIEGAVNWWIGDWLNYGEQRWGEMYSQALQDGTGLREGTLANLKYVAQKVEPSRRRENLPWSHHAEVAALEFDQQEQILMDAAPEAGSTTPRLSTRQVRERAGAVRLNGATAFDWADEERFLAGWLERRRQSWPAGRRDEFAPLVGRILETLE